MPTRETSRAMRSAAIATWATFFLAGALAASWTVRIPAVKAKLSLTDGQIGLEVLGWGLAALVAMQAAAPLIGRFGSRRVLQLSVPGMALSLIPVGLAPSFFWLIAAGVVYGLMFGLLDVAMNTQAALIQTHRGESVMGRMHAGWSLGAVSGGLLGALSAQLGTDFTTAMVLFGGIGFPVALVIGRGYLRDRTPAPDGPRPSRARTRLAPVVPFLAVITFCVFLAEGAVADWSGILLHGHLGATEALAALAYPLFEGVMAVGRLAGDRWSGRVPPPVLLAATGVAAAVAFSLPVLATDPVVALAGFALAGLTMCLAGPTALSLAGSADPTTAAAAIARASTFGYAGLLLGPVAIGLVADAWDLRVGFAVVVVVCLGWAVVGWWRGPPFSAVSPPGTDRP